jgi:hypothetical protein
MAISLAPLAAAHLPSVAAIQAAIYPHCFNEDVSLIFARASAYPAGHLVAILEGSDAVIAYASAYPWPLAAALAAPPSLGALDVAQILAADASPGLGAAFFLHEVSVYVQGVGVGAALMGALLAHAEARGFTTALLVSVLGNEAYYERKFGFEAVRELPPYGMDNPAPEPAVGERLPPTPSHFSVEARATLMRLALPRLK